MSIHLYIELEKGIQGFDSNSSDRVILAKSQDELADIALALGVKPLVHFYTYDADTLGQFIRNHFFAVHRLST